MLRQVPKLKQFGMSVRRCLGTVSWKMPWSVPVETQSALISPECLASAIKSESDVVVLDSTVLIASEATGYDEYSKQRIPGAKYLDLDLIGDTSYSSAPHNLPKVDRFCEEMDRIGIQDTHTKIVLYDTLGLFSAPRAWYTFLAMGHDEDQVFVLDGGLPAWERGGFELDTNKPSQAGQTTESSGGAWNLRHASMQWGLQDVYDWLDADSNTKIPLLDARSAGRFHATAPEPRPGMRGGHIPGSLSLPFSELVQADGTLRPRAELREILHARVGVQGGLPEGNPAVALTCGSGLTAAIVALALHEIGLPVKRQAIYDGSWSEWGGRADTPVATE